MIQNYGNYIYTAPNDWLMHHGIKGQKWGIRRYQNEDGSLTPEGKQRYKKMSANIESISKHMAEMEKFVDLTKNLKPGQKALVSSDDLQKARKITETIGRLDSQLKKDNMYISKYYRKIMDDGHDYLITHLTDDVSGLTMEYYSLVR